MNKLKYCLFTLNNQPFQCCRTCFSYGSVSDSCFMLTKADTEIVMIYPRRTTSNGVNGELRQIVSDDLIV